MRMIRLLLPLGLVTVFAIAGTVVNYVLLRNNVGGPLWLRVVALSHLQPFAGRLLGPGLGFRDIVTWLVGLVVLLVVLGAFILLAARWGAVSAFLGGWLGTMVGSALAGLVSAVLYVGRLFPSRPGGSTYEGYADQKITYVYNLFGNGLYYGLFVGILVGLTAIAVGAGRTAAPVVAPSSPAAPTV